jgi:endonuclease/exonuclease/phosphatase family metal-dependent hydrolase
MVCHQRKLVVFFCTIEKPKRGFMRYKFIFLLFIVPFLALAQVSVLSWNIQNLGKSKSDATIEFIASTVKSYDVLAIQEVVAGNGGAQAVARLAAALNRKGFKWDYCISDPTQTTGGTTERYAFLWKPSRVKLIGKAWLEKQYAQQIEREPYLATFAFQGKQFTLASFHAVPKSKQPEREIKLLAQVTKEYPDLNLIFLGDFNCPQSNNVFNNFRKMNYQSAFVNQKTSLKRSCKNGNCLASEYDNIFYASRKVKRLKSFVIPFYTQFENLTLAKKISDHIPVVAEFSLN